MTTTSWNDRGGSWLARWRPSSVHLSGSSPTIRRIEADDAKSFQVFVQHLSRQSRRDRFLSTFDALPADLLTALVDVEAPFHVGLVAEVRHSSGAFIIGEARYAREAYGVPAEVAIVVTDEWQRQGIGARLMCALWSIACANDVQTLFCNVENNNRAMCALALSSGYRPADADDFAGTRRFEKRR